MLAVLGAAALIVVGVNAATYAATGSSLIMGKTNKASKSTTIQRTTSGPALKIKTKKSTSAPFTTNAKGKVTNLNADKLDGLTSSQFIAKSNAAMTAANDTKALTFKDPASSRAGNTVYDLPTIPKGVYLVSFNAAVDLTTDGTMTCQLYTPSSFIGSHTWAGNTVANAGNYNGPAFTTVMNLTGTEDLKISCITSGGDGWSSSGVIILFSGTSPNISFTKLDGLTAQNMTP